jgi:hypothetical protein
MAKRRQRFDRDDPRRHRGAEVLGQERSQRGRLPALDVARRPVVDQTEAEDVIGRLADPDRRAERVAGAHPDGDFQLEIELQARAERRRRRGTDQPLAVRAAHRHTRCADARCARVIGDRNVLVVGGERRILAAPPPAVRRVLDARKEIGECADRRRNMHFACGLLVQKFACNRLDFGALGPVGGQQ